MDVGIATFRLLALSQVLLFAAAVMSSRAPRLRQLLLLLLTSTVAAYLALPLAAAVGSPLPIRAVLAVLATSCPLALLLVVLDLFEERALDVWVGAVVVFCTALAIAQVVFANGPLGPALMLVMHATKLALVGLAGVLLWRGRRSELVELRRWMRGGLVLVIGVVALAVLTVEWAFAWQVPVRVELPGMAAIFVLTLAANLGFWRFDPTLSVASMPSAPSQADAAPSDHLPSRRSPSGAPGASSEPAQPGGDTGSAGVSLGTAPLGEADALLGRIDASMRAGRLYADHDLRIATLAARLGVPEYRVRRAINGGLGFRNFNHYVNSFRIDEASQRLRSERQLPVLSIALDVGFRSISSFNVAFRERHGCAPGEFRDAVPPES